MLRNCILEIVQRFNNMKKPYVEAVRSLYEINYWFTQKKIYKPYIHVQYLYTYTITCTYLHVPRLIRFKYISLHFMKINNTFFNFDSTNIPDVHNLYTCTTYAHYMYVYSLCTLVHYMYVYSLCTLVFSLCTLVFSFYTGMYLYAFYTNVLWL